MQSMPKTVIFMRLDFRTADNLFRVVKMDSQILGTIAQKNIGSVIIEDIYVVFSAVSPT